MSKRLRFAVLAVVCPLVFAAPAVLAATPKDTVVFAWQLDGIITFDPDESYGIVIQSWRLLDRTTDLRG